MKAGPMPSNRQSIQSGLNGIGEVFSVILCYLCIWFFYLTSLAYIVWFLAMCFYEISGCAKMWLSEPLRSFFCVLFLCLFFLFCPILLCFFLLYLSLLLLDTCLFSNGSEKGRLAVWVLGGSGRSWRRRIVIRICIAWKKSNFLQVFYNSSIL